MPARDLARRADERRDLVGPGEGEIDELSPSLAVGAENEEPHGVTSYRDDRTGPSRVTERHATSHSCPAGGLLCGSGTGGRRTGKEDTVSRIANGALTRRETILYRTATGLVYAVMVFSVINFIFNDHFPFPNGPEGAFVHLGLPGWFKAELTIAKILGLLALSIPSVPARVKEFAYFGFGITLMSASIAHFSRGDARLSILFVIDPLVFLGLLMVSYFYFEKRRSPGGAEPRMNSPESTGVPFTA
ncbi:MAG: hypothetical protein DMF78_14590 [Acidobacteria bacterium]|nr:MAG: hypothetical protein DMF78_14590 [Acidobacteriota bacterium]